MNGLISAKPELHNGAIAKRRSTLAKALDALLPARAEHPSIAISTAPGCWSDALSFPVDVPRLRELADDDAVIVRCRVRVHEGSLGIGMVADDGSTYVSNERTVAAGDATRSLGIWLREPGRSRRLLFRNVEPDGKLTRFDFFDVAVQILPGARTFPATWSSPSVRTIEAGELVRLLDWAHRIWDGPFQRKTAGTPSTMAIEIVDVDDLPSLLGTRGAPAVPPGAKDKLLADWKMEIDDAPILEHLWRARAPRRHLEFGTWEGFGAALVARCTDAEIWTLNLPQGEATTEGTSLYASTDAGESIGRIYREAGVAGRVHQLLCDSRDFDTGAFAADFFDTVLIDGGHTPDVVENDTEKALRVLRPGGLCVWHDFCPDPDALARNLAPLGVVQAIAENIDRWRPLFGRFFWIRKSWVLVGERTA